MPTDNRATNVAENETQQEPMPSSEQKTTEPGASENAQEVVSQPTEGQLPAEVKERTKAEFEKLRDDLRAEKARREYLEQVFNSMQTKPAPEVKQEEKAPLYDPTTGLLNEQYLTDVDRRAREAAERAARAEAAIVNYERQQLARSDEQQRTEAFAKFPQLQPGDKQDKEFHVATRRVLLDSLANPQDYGLKDRPLTFLEAAEIASKHLPRTVESAREEGARSALEQLTPKEQAAYEATGTSGRRTQLSDDLQSLKEKSRRGNIDAIAERLRRLKS